MSMSRFFPPRRSVQESFSVGHFTSRRLPFPTGVSCGVLSTTVVDATWSLPFIGGLEGGAVWGNLEGHDVWTVGLGESLSFLPYGKAIITPRSPRREHVYLLVVYVDTALRSPKSHGRFP
jgi:hypothetical protein